MNTSSRCPSNFPALKNQNLENKRALIWKMPSLMSFYKKDFISFGVFFHVGGKVFSFMHGTVAGNASILEHRPELGHPQHRKEGNCLCLTAKIQ